MGSVGGGAMGLSASEGKGPSGAPEQRLPPGEVARQPRRLGRAGERHQSPAQGSPPPVEPIGRLAFSHTRRAEGMDGPPALAPPGLRLPAAWLLLLPSRSEGPPRLSGRRRVRLANPAGLEVSRGASLRPSEARLPARKAGPPPAAEASRRPGRAGLGGTAGGRAELAGADSAWLRLCGSLCSPLASLCLAGEPRDVSRDSTKLSAAAGQQSPAEPDQGGGCAE